ncbi:MAG: hypothetical protein WBN57_02340 [Gammaproteobacteria bacterium]|jgi:hypothetical protein
MRLLEFSHTDGDADQQETAHIAARIKDRSGIPTPQPRVHSARQAASPATADARVFPVKGSRIQLPAQRGPIDLENLQQRVAILEKRIRMRMETAQASSPDLEELKQRLLKLERNINSELWAAKQREYTLLEMLARPSPGARIAAGIARFRSHHLPAIGRALAEAAREWWQDSHPDWWPGFARAWRESLDNARNSIAPK